ncbi:MAG: (2Fe-2S)-binding protein [Syntrophomonadaceae bacterium]|nr:(2Fe-2S)-binding protein [Syntrophomonadaceae bacterium]
MKKMPITLIINGDSYDLLVPAHRTLLDALREDIGLTGAKKGCGEGECGACTVLLDGQPVNSCLILAVQAAGKMITTIEGLARENRLHPLQDAFVQHGAIQCGFCSPGFILTAKALLDSNPAPTEQEVREAVAGNLCRCTGYQNIIEAILAAAKEIGGDEK